MTREIKLPNCRIKSKIIDREKQQAALTEGYHPIVAKILAARELPKNCSFSQYLQPKLKDLDHPSKLIGIESAAERVARAIENHEIIGIETDHDCDGQTSHAVLMDAFCRVFKVPKINIRSYIGHRLTEGYGLSESVAKRILQDPKRPTLIITADNGSSDEPRIQQLKAAGIDVIITDHHEIPASGIPKSAFACLNPTRQDCRYGDPYIAGCMVAWLLMAATRRHLIEKGYLTDTAESLAESLDFVAVGTIADCVSLSRSLNNRIVVYHGLQQIAALRRPCWRAIQRLQTRTFSSEDIAFRVGPLLNSDGRLADAFSAVNFLLSDTDDEAMALVYTLDERNTERKQIQQKIVEQGMNIATDNFSEDQFSISLFFPEGHVGVQGIVASRLKEAFGRPTALFSPKPGVIETISGSVRGIEHFHVRNALQRVYEQQPEAILSFGGHRGAGGITLKKEAFEWFRERFELAAKEQLAKEEVGPILWTEGRLLASDITKELLDNLETLEPYGREFERPVFELIGTVESLRLMGDKTHARVQLRSDGQRLNAIWFKIRPTPEAVLPIKVEDRIKIAFTPKWNTFGGQRQIDIQILGYEPSVSIPTNQTDVINEERDILETSELG